MCVGLSGFLRGMGVRVSCSLPPHLKGSSGINVDLCETVYELVRISSVPLVVSNITWACSIHALYDTMVAGPKCNVNLQCHVLCPVMSDVTVALWLGFAAVNHLRNGRPLSLSLSLHIGF
jgi:hypothetical protein